MMRLTVSAFMTSEDLLEIAAKMKKIEQGAKLGTSMIASTWTIDSPDCMTVEVNFSCDQDRARKQGLMK